MKILALDTSLEHCSAAVIFDGQLISYRSKKLIRGHAEQIASMVSDVVIGARFELLQFDRIGVVVGPGSFAGVRVGLSFARGIGVSGGPDVVGVNTLRALACGAFPAAHAARASCVAAVIDARQGNVYAALYEASGACLVEPFIAPADKAREILTMRAPTGAFLCVGPASSTFCDPSNDLCAHTPEVGNDSIDPVVVARLAQQSNMTEVSTAPLYLRPPDAAASSSNRFSSLQ